MWKWILALVLVIAAAGAAAVFALSGGAINVSNSSGEATETSAEASANDGTSDSDDASDGGFLAGLFGNMGKPPEATPVRVQPADVGDLVRTVSAPGSIEPRTLINISSQVSAKILALPFREGDQVKQSDVVVRLDPLNLLAQQASAEASLMIEQARLDGAKADQLNARIELDRLTQLHETGDVPKSELDAAEARFLQSQSNLGAINGSIAVAEANIERVKRDLSNTVIESPIDGTVTALNTEVGETAIVGTTNTPGSVIMEVADRARMLLVAQVDETNIAPVRVGQTAAVYINAYADREYTGVIERIGLKRQVSAQGTGFFEVEIALDLAEGETLLNGLTASADINVETFYDVVKVPSQAVLDRRVDELPDDIGASPHINPDKSFARVVYRLIDGKAVATPVEVGPSDLRDTVVVAGLEPGDAVVVGPYKELATIAHDDRIRDEAESEDAASDGDPIEKLAGEPSSDDSDNDAADAATDDTTTETAEGNASGAATEAAAATGSTRADG